MFWGIIDINARKIVEKSPERSEGFFGSFKGVNIDNPEQSSH